MMSSSSLRKADHPVSGQNRGRVDVRRMHVPGAQAQAAVVALVVVASGALGTASAAAQPAREEGKAPYSDATPATSTTCTPGATCTATADADRQTGQAASAVGYSRTASSTGAESAEGRSTFTLPVRLAKGVTAATVTATWNIETATAAALSMRGTLRAGSLLFADIACDGGCTASGTVTQVTLACSTEGASTCIGTPGTDPGRAEGVNLTVTATVHNLAKSSFTFRTQALSYVGAGPVCGSSTDPDRPFPLNEDCSLVIDPAHAGTASSELRGSLVGIHVDAA